VWHKFDQNLIREKISTGTLVIVDITADWCVTCKVNKFTTLDNKKMLEYFTENKIYTMRADITSYNKEILDYLAQFRRHGIPFTVIYSSNKPNGIILPEIITPSKLIKAINDAK
jgi:suppressor for copper-sensitivity B